MLKLVSTDDFGFDEPSVRIMPISSRGIDQGWEVKTAAVLTKEIADLRPLKGYTHVHVLAVGDTEKYGANRNGDGFSGYWNAKNHVKFVKSGRVHKNHKNKDPATAVGQIKLSAHNPNMGRIELVMALDNNKCAQELSDYEAGRDLGVSMGCRVAYDVCSICEHKAPNPSQYCVHAKTAMGRILEDGRQVYVDNPDPDYFEQSLVGRPADRCGYAFRKVAEDLSDGRIVSSVDLFKSAGLWVPHHILAEEMTKKAQCRLSILQKLAEIEKEIETTLTPVDSRLADNLPDEALSDDDIAIAQSKGEDSLEQTFDAMGKAKVMLPLRDFLKLINRNGHFDVEDVAPAVSQQLPGCFGRMLDDDPIGACENGLFDSSGGVLPQSISRMVNGLIPSLGMGSEPLGRRVSITIIRSKPENKMACVPKVYDSDPVIKGLANLYAGYKLSFITNHGDDDPVLTRAAVLHHYR